jgi:hypothetical protein
VAASQPPPVQRTTPVRDSPAAVTPPASAANEDTPSQAKPGLLERLATATKNLANGFHEFETTKKVADEAPFEVKLESRSVVIITALDSDLEFNDVVINKGHCNPFYAVYHFEFNYEGNPNPYHLFEPGTTKEYGEQLRILAFDTEVTEQALDHSPVTGHNILGATIRGVHDCTIYEIDIVTNKGGGKYRFQQ